MTSQGVDGTVDKAGRILPDSNQRVKKVNDNMATENGKYKIKRKGKLE